MIVTPTRYSIQGSNFVYTAHHHKGVWSIQRRKIESPNIPPCTEIQTEHGWQGVLNNNDRVEAFRNIDNVVTFVTEDDANTSLAA